MFPLVAAVGTDIVPRIIGWIDRLEKVPARIAFALTAAMNAGDHLAATALMAAFSIMARPKPAINAIPSTSHVIAVVSSSAAMSSIAIHLIRDRLPPESAYCPQAEFGVERLRAMKRIGLLSTGVDAS